MGLQGLAWLGMLLGSMGSLHGAKGLWVVGAGILLSLWFWVSDVRSRCWTKERIGKGLRYLHRPLFWAFASVVLVGMGPALSLPDGWDELVYHHALPKRWYLDGYPALYSDLPYSGFPSKAETLFWLLASVDTRYVPRLVSYGCWALAWFGTYYLFRRQLSRRYATGLSFVFIACSTPLMTSQNCFVESMQWLDVASMLLLMPIPSRARSSINSYGRAIPLGIVASGPSSIKLTGFAIALVPALWQILSLRFSDQRGFPKALANFFCFSIVAILVTAPFYVRPWFATGVPTYPYFADWFVSSESMAMMSRHHHELGSNFGLRSAIGFFTAPIMMTFLEDLYDGGFGWQSLIMIAMIGSGFVRWKRSRRLSLRRIDRRSSTLLWTGLGLYSFWFFTSQQARFAIPFFLVLFLVASLFLALCSRRAKRVWMMVALCASCLSIPYATTGYYLATWGTVLGLVSEEDHLREGTGGTYIDLVHYLNAKPSPCHPLLVLEHRTFYLNHPSRIITPNFQLGPLTPARHFQNSESLGAALRDSQGTHLVVAKQIKGPDMASSSLDAIGTVYATIEQGAKEGLLSLEWESEDYLVFVIRTDRVASGL